MARNKDHDGLKKLESQFNDGKMSRREFIRYSTLLGVSATAAYSMVGMVAPRPVAAADDAQGRNAAHRDAHVLQIDDVRILSQWI